MTFAIIIQPRDLVRTTCTPLQLGGYSEYFGEKHGVNDVVSSLIRLTHFSDT